MEEPGRLQSMGSLESDTTERLHFHFSLSYIGEGNSNPLQCSCLENPRDGGAWWAAIYGVTQSRTLLKRLSSSSSSSSLALELGQCCLFTWFLSENSKDLGVRNYGGERAKKRSVGAPPATPQTSVLFQISFTVYSEKEIVLIPHSLPVSRSLCFISILLSHATLDKIYLFSTSQINVWINK